jgi:hypothetical protein
MGNIRVIYSINDSDKIVYIEVIGFRGNVYKKMRWPLKLRPRLLFCMHLLA